MLLDPALPAMTPERRHVIIVVRSFGFPHGMANTNRVRLLGRALDEQNVDVTVLCMRVSETPGAVRNTNVRGDWNGISFIYTPGTTVRSPAFLVRRYRELRGYVNALYLLAKRKRSGQADCAFFWLDTVSWRLGPWLMVRVLRWLRIPVVIDLSERPWPTPRFLPAVSKHLSLLDGVAGVVAISAWLSSWAAAEADRIGQPILVTRVPIVVDVNESAATEYPHDDEVLVYAAASGYDEALAFILATLPAIWSAHPHCRLVVTGSVGARLLAAKPTTALGQILTDARCQLLGYVARSELLRLYAEARALLIPLFDDDMSQARFPTKIGEYLAAARPVVTTHVGEIDNYLIDGKTAYIALPGNVAAYAAKINAILDDPEQAAAVGLAGRQVAEKHFHYSLNGPKLRAFVDSLVFLTGQEVASD